MQTPKSSEVLAFCHELFPGLNWVILQDSDDLEVQYQRYSAENWKWRIWFELLIQSNGSTTTFGCERVQLMRSLNKQGQTFEQALTEIHAAWLEYCKDMASATQQPKL